MGLLALPFVLLAGSARLRTGLFVVGAPAVALAVVHAAVSVSIPRYNIALATVYAPVVAYGLGRVASAVLAALKTKRRQAE